MAIAHFKKITEKHIKKTKPKHHKYSIYLIISVITNIILLLTTLYRGV